MALSEKRKAQARAYYHRNRERCLEATKRYRQRHPERFRGWWRARAGLPAALRPCPELCEAGCGRKAICLDHDHETGLFRGWLCRRCNLGLGAIGDTLSAARRLVSYLERA